jgi:hypothetical protein
MKLSELKVKAVKPGATKTKLFDGVGVFTCSEPPEGGKLWRWGYRLHGKYKTMSLGAYPVMMLAAARDQHLEARKLLKSGIDPMVQRKSEKVIHRTAHDESFESVARAWHGHWKNDKNPDYAVDVMIRLTRDVFPVIGSTLVRRVEAPTIVRLVKRIEERGAAEVAKRTYLERARKEVPSSCIFAIA